MVIKASSIVINLCFGKWPFKVINNLYASSCSVTNWSYVAVVSYMLSGIEIIAVEHFDKEFLSDCFPRAPAVLMMKIYGASARFWNTVQQYCLLYEFEGHFSCTWFQSILLTQLGIFHWRKNWCDVASSICHVGIGIWRGTKIFQIAT